MVISLLKKEFRESLKIFVPIIVLAVALISLTQINTIYQRNYYEYNSAMSNMASSLTWKISFALAIALAVAGMLGGITYLYRNIYNNKGYELFTLPVKSWEIMFSKTIIVIFWAVSLVLTYIVLSIFFESMYSESFTLDNLLRLKHLLFLEGDKFRYIRAYLNVFMFLLIGIMTMLFAGAFTNSKYIRKGRPVVMFIIVLVIIIFVLNISFTMNPGINWLSLSQYDSEFYSGFGYLPGDLNKVLLIRAFITLVLAISTNYLWNHKLQF